jgi:glucokinase
MSKKEFFIGVDIGGTNIKGAVFNKNFDLIFKKKIQTLSYRNSSEILKDINLLIDECTDKITGKNSDIAGIGMVLPGYPDKNGIVSFMPGVPTLANIPIKDCLDKNRNTEIMFENDGNASAHAEYIFANNKLKNIIVLTLGTGIGSGVIIDGKLLKGKNNISGELGHITLNENGPKCLCGKRGCLESYFSAYGINIYAKKIIKKNYSSLNNYNIDDIDPLIIAIEAKKGDKIAKNIYEYSGKWLGLGISIFMNIFNPEKIILAGGIAKDFQLFKETMIDEIKKNIHIQYGNNINIEISKFSDDLGLFGAVSLFSK